MKKVIISLVCIALFALTLTACTTTPADTPDDVISTEDITYINGKYSFSLTFPPTWTGYKAQRITENLPEGSDEQINFSINNEVVFELLVYLTTDWEEASATEIDPMPVVIGEDDVYTFAYLPNEDVQSDEAQDALDDMDTIMASFTVVDL